MDALIAIQQLISSKNYVAIAVIVIGYMVRITAPDSKFPLTIPPRWKPVVVLSLGQLYGQVVAVSHGMEWKHAVWHGFMTALVTMGLFDVVMKAFFNGNEPKWVKWLAVVVDAPETKEVVKELTADDAPSGVVKIVPQPNPPEIKPSNSIVQVVEDSIKYPDDVPTAPVLPKDDEKKS